MTLTYNAQEPSSEGVDRHIRVISLWHHSPDSGEGTRISIPISIDLVTFDQNPAKVDFQLRQVAILDVTAALNCLLTVFFTVRVEGRN